ncbi:MAG TPA: arsenate reductase ArsC [Bryobacteraceae bacterium]|nr:arsenate reductase ArsC [Bryobacteraceae bacterium]
MDRSRVLFLCIGNACRSQMAEGFARAYGSDVMEACSAGLFPAGFIPPLTIKVMQEKNIDLSAALSKGLAAAPKKIDLLINMTGQKISPPGVMVEEWKITDPIGMSEQVFRQVAAEIEQRVMRLVLMLRARQGGEGVARAL